MERWAGKVALVTGASAGIGEHVTRTLLKHGITVVGLARRIDRLENIAKDVAKLPGKFYPIQADMTKEEDIVKAFEWVRNNLSGIDILINNAGVIRNTNLTSGDTKLWKEVFDTNVMGLCIASREGVQLMKEKNISEGHIIQVNSIAGHHVPSSIAPRINVYCGSKHAVTALTQTLRYEINTLKLPIKVTSLSPGYVRTEISVAGNMGRTQAELDQFPGLDPEDISHAVIAILSASPNCNITELTIQPLGEMY